MRKLRRLLQFVRWSATTAFAFAIALLFGFASAPAAHAEGPINVAVTSKAIVFLEGTWPAKVVVSYNDKSTLTYTTDVSATCSGFFVTSDGYIATAGHCVETSTQHQTAAKNQVVDALVKKGTKINGTGADYNWPVTFGEPTFVALQPNTPTQQDVFKGGPITVRYVDHQSFMQGDNALLQLANVSGMPTLEIAKTEPATQDSIVYAGYPGNVTDTTDSSRQPPTFKNAKVASLTTTKGGVPIVQLDTQIAHGMSGGPAMNTNGKVVGINSSGFQASTESFITTTDMLNRFLDKNGIKTAGATAAAPSAQVATGPNVAAAPNDNNGSSIGLILAGITFIVLIIGVIVVVVYLLRQRSRTQRMAASNNSHQWPSRP